MRTYEDVKAALRYYTDELANEKGQTYQHFVVSGGGLCISRKGISQYILSKNNPTPMKRETAIKNLEKFQSMCTDDVKLEIYKYCDWLESNIKECNGLIECIQRSMAGEQEPSVTDTPDHEQATAAGNPERLIPVAFEFPQCPYGVNTCYTCRFVSGVDTGVLPWRVICSAGMEKSTANG